MAATGREETTMKLTCKLLAIAILFSAPVAAIAQQDDKSEIEALKKGQGQGRKQAWGKALAPALGANGSVPPPYQKFHPDERWKTVYSSSYTPHPSSTYQEMIDGGVKHSDSAMRHAESVRLARMNVALTKLKPAEVAKSMAEQCARATPSPLSHSPAHPPFSHVITKRGVVPRFVHVLSPAVE